MVLAMFCSTVLLACQKNGGETDPGDVQEKELKVMSFNILHEVPSNPPGYTWPERKDRQIALFEKHNPAILCAQEDLFGQGLAITGAMGWGKIGVSKTTGTADGSGEFCGIYYDKERLELKVSGHFWLSETPGQPSIGWDASTNRICTWARFSDAHAASDFYVFNLHANHTGVKSRLESSKLVLNRIQSIAGDMPVILAGDFNATPDAKSINILMDHLNFARDVSISQPTGPTGTYNGMGNPPFTRLIDYIFVNDRFQVLQYATLDDADEQGFYPSDHFPVLAVLKQP